MTLPVEAWRLEGISPRAYQHPADRAATAALAKVPYLDQVVRKLVSLGYERALRVASLGAAVKARPGAAAARVGAAPAGLQRARHGGRAGPLHHAVPDRQRVHVRHRQAGRGDELGAGAAARRRRSPRRARPRGRARALRPRPLPHRADDPAAARRLGATADPGRTAAAGDPAGAAGVGARHRAQLRPRRRDRDARPAGRLPCADDDRRRRGGPAARTSTRSSHRAWSTTKAAAGSSG